MFKRSGGTGTFCLCRDHDCSISCLHSGLDVEVCLLVREDVCAGTLDVLVLVD